MAGARLLLRPLARPRAALGDGWLVGTVFFVVLLRWLDFTFENYSAIPWPLTWLPIVTLAAYCGLYVGMVAMVVSLLKARLGPGWALATAPVLWVSGEWIRGWLMGGFPWGLLGYSQHRALPVIQIAEVGGVYAVSLLLVAVNAAIAGSCVLGPRRAAMGSAAVAIMLALSIGFGWLMLSRGSAPRSQQSIQISVIQPAIEQGQKWDPAYQAETLAVYERLTREAARSKPAAVFWPETAAPIFLRGDPVLLGQLLSLVKDTGVPILVGSIDRLPGPNGKFLNSAFLLGDQGITAKYDKIQLVPFGEYIPLASVIGFVKQWAEFISDFAPGTRQTVFPLKGASFGTVICYEVIFPDLFRGFAAGGASFMANITNDAWFGRTSGPWQHLGTLPSAPSRIASPSRAPPTPACRRSSGRTDASVPRCPFRARLPHLVRAPSLPRHALHALRQLARLCLPRPVRRSGGGGPLPETRHGMLSDLKRELADVEKRMQDLRGHL